MAVKLPLPCVVLPGTESQCLPAAGGVSFGHFEIAPSMEPHHVAAVEGPREALAFLNGHPNINLVLTDVVMPEMDGYELAAEINKIAPGARIVFMSGYAHDAGRQPVDDNFLAKPFTAESLTHVVRHAMARA